MPSIKRTTKKLSKRKMLNYQEGVLKRRFKIGAGKKTPPGTFISKANEAKASFKAGVKGLI